jgi:P-type E1-E2 ATPase
LALGDRLRADARPVVARLQRGGYNVVLLSGDAEATTRSVAESLGIGDYLAEVKPQGKLECLRRLKAEGRKVAMVGDGINDAPALAEASLGIAMGSGTALAMEAAHVVLTTPALDLIPATFDLAALTMRTIRRNLFWAFFYNALGISLAVGGLLNPLLAAAAMVLSSLSVTVQSARLGGWGIRRV